MPSFASSTLGVRAWQQPRRHLTSVGADVRQLIKTWFSRARRRYTSRSQASSARVWQRPLGGTSRLPATCQRERGRSLVHHVPPKARQRYDARNPEGASAVLPSTHPVPAVDPLGPGTTSEPHKNTPPKERQFPEWRPPASIRSSRRVFRHSEERHRGATFAGVTPGLQHMSNNVTSRLVLGLQHPPVVHGNRREPETRATNRLRPCETNCLAGPKSRSSASEHNDAAVLGHMTVSRASYTVGADGRRVRGDAPRHCVGPRSLTSRTVGRPTGRAVESTRRPPGAGRRSPR